MNRREALLAVFGLPVMMRAKPKPITVHADLRGALLDQKALDALARQVREPLVRSIYGCNSGGIGWMPPND